ncbi:hypothetical protein [Coxiella-like endosymbiont of Rhipicephalus sanguineus]|uniref:hypothetical protein n=1 Tax=Coxiella-like endosymbiont of Rhipicephalus sanguineus TaxID=1955402 RepID=UPI00203DF526|nr:hypothetical protein [Coxiella-like endosymbiont of Rhipicephalus sanguineus]
MGACAGHVPIVAIPFFESVTAFDLQQGGIYLRGQRGIRYFLWNRLLANGFNLEAIKRVSRTTTSRH